MREIINRLDDLTVNPAINQNEFELEIKTDPDNIDSESLLTVSSLDFTYQDATKINALITRDGINRGIPYSMSIKEGGSELKILDAYLVVNGSEAIYSKEYVKNLRIERRNKNDSLSRRAKLITYTDLLAEGFFTTDDYIKVPYIISSIPDYKGAAIISVTAFIVLDKLVVAGKEVLKVLADLGGVLSALAGILKIVVIVLWVIITLLTLILFMFSIIDQLIQPVKYHAGMLWGRLLEIGCEKLGYTFESSIFQDEFVKDTVILPAKFEIQSDEDDLFKFGSTIHAETQLNGHYDGSFFDLLQDTKETFRAFINITSDNRLIIEKIGTPLKNPSFKMNPLIKMDEWTTNADEIIGNYGVQFRQDSADDNTKKNYQGTVTTAITTRTVKSDTDLVDGEKVVTIPFARGTAKDGFTPVEKLADRLLKAYHQPVADIIILINEAVRIRNKALPIIKMVRRRLGIIGILIPFKTVPIPPIPPLPVKTLEGRDGMLSIENDFFSEAKIISLDIKNDPRSTNIKSTNRARWNSGYVYHKYHTGQSHVPTKEFPFGNQKRGYTAINTKVCREDLIKVIDNSIIFAPNGERSELREFKHNIHTANSNISYWVPFISDPYLKIKVTTL